MIGLVLLSVLGGMCLGAGLVAHARVRALVFKDVGPPDQKLLPDGGDDDVCKVEEWKRVFRDTVVAAEGGLSPAMDEFLEGRVSAVPSVKGMARPLLIGNARKEYDADRESSKTSHEVFNVDERWHKKGFRFTLRWRSSLLTNAANEDTRNAYRKMFDEQDAVRDQTPNVVFMLDTETKS